MCHVIDGPAMPTIPAISFRETPGKRQESQESSAWSGSAGGATPSFRVRCTGRYSRNTLATCRCQRIQSSSLPRGSAGGISGCLPLSRSAVREPLNLTPGFAAMDVKDFLAVPVPQDGILLDLPVPEGCEQFQVRKKSSTGYTSTGANDKRHGNEHLPQAEVKERYRFRVLGLALCRVGMRPRCHAVSAIIGGDSGRLARKIKMMRATALAPARVSWVNGSLGGDIRFMVLF